MDDDQKIEQFKNHCHCASYHYADDSAKEWGLADREKNAAMQIWNDNPHLQGQLREAHKGNLWSLELELKTRERLRQMEKDNASKQ